MTSAPVFGVERYLKQRRAVIDRTLDRALRAGAAPRAIHQAMRYALFSGGKRLRPMLMLASGEMFGAAEKNLLPFAAAMEMIHTYSIIHDDLPALDDDDFRRGAPATHKKFTEGIALLAGDALLTEAFHLVSQPGVARALGGGRVLGLIRELAQAAGVAGMVGGQAAELEAAGRKPDVAAVEKIHARKTGALILASVRIGATLGGAPPKALARVNRYGRALGLAFQIADDIMDMSEHSGDGNKNAAYPAVVGVAAAERRARSLLDQCLKALDGFGKNADPLRAIARMIVEPALTKKLRGPSAER